MSDSGGLSRRDFLKGFSAVPVAAGVVAAGARSAEADEKGPAVLGPGPVPITLNVNGRDRAIQVPPRTTLLNALRTHLNHTGPKEVCNSGACGSCTVLVDGAPMNSCLMLAVDAPGRKITTVEGLADGDRLAPIQQAFVNHDGLQCGYCTPGFLCSLSALFAKNAKPNGEEIRDACSGNLCRCAAYAGIFAAAEAVARGKPDGGIIHGDALMKLGGDDLKKILETQGIPRIEAPDKVTGRARYCSDQRPAGLLYLRTLTSPFAEATLDSKPNLERARAVPGVKEVVVSSNDSPGVGSAVAYAIADDPQAADEALAALGLRLSPRPKPVDPARVFAEAKKTRTMERGGFDDPAKVEAALAKADVVISGTYEIQTVQHCSLEPHGALAHWEGEEITVYESTQAVCGTRDAVAKAAGVGQGAARVVCTNAGGGFGSKLGMWSETPRAIKAAKSAGAPVHYFANRAAELLVNGGRSPQVVQIKAGAKKDGSIVAEWRKVMGGAGSYWYDVPMKSMIRVQDSVIGYGGFPPLRGPGNPEAQFVMESVVEDLANALGMDPLEFRLKNMPRLKDWFTRGGAAIGWERRKPFGSQKGGIRRGFGVGCGDFAGTQGCHFVEVEVDTLTGVVRVVKAVAVMQGGFVNRMGTLSQIYGGTIMGMSWAMFEERIMDRASGAMLNANLDGYKIAGARDIPEIEVILIGQQGKPGGVGEAPVVPIGGAVRNAIVNATGRPIYKMPFSPRNVLGSIA